MDGKSLVDTLGLTIREQSTSTFLDDKLSYDNLWEAAKEVNRRTKYLTSTQTITTVAGQADYDLNADFMELYFEDQFNRLIIKYETSSGDITWPTWRDYDKIIQADDTAVPVPSNFTVSSKQTLTGRITGTATATGTLSYEESTLTDSGAPFSYVETGDTVHNTKDGSYGVVISKTSSSALVTALFGGTLNYWTSADTYVVIPQGRKTISLSPPPSNSGDSVTVYYVQTPDPVYSSYRTYRIDDSYELAIIYYAAWLYRVRDKDVSDYFYAQFEKRIRQGNAQTNRAFNRNKSIKVNLRKRSLRDRSYR